MKKLTKKWQVLEEAKKHLAWSTTSKELDKKETMICFAINAALTHDNFDEYVAHDLKLIINTRLEGCVGLWSWLDSKQKVSKKELHEDGRNFSRKLQATRHAWVDSMIAEFKAKDE